MASTRELAGYILQNNEDLRNWFASEHEFTVEKAKTGDFESYKDLINAILCEGVNKKVITQAQADGGEDL